MNLYDDGVWGLVKSVFFNILSLLDSMQWGDFSYLELLLGFLMISSFMPVVLNLRNIDNSVVSGYYARNSAVSRVDRWAGGFSSYAERIW